MKRTGYVTHRSKRPVKKEIRGSIDDIVREITRDRDIKNEEYREQSLKMHGLFCARCGRQFDHTDRHLLTVHHKDGNHNNNPPDGSNWENLCTYCHDDVHGRNFFAADEEENRQ